MRKTIYVSKRQYKKLLQGFYDEFYNTEDGDFGACCEFPYEIKKESFWKFW